MAVYGGSENGQIDRMHAETQKVQGHLLTSVEDRPYCQMLKLVTHMYIEASQLHWHYLKKICIMGGPLFNYQLHHVVE